MTTIELNLQKVELAKQILNESDENVLKKTMNYFNKLKKTTIPKPPCQMTIGELKEEVNQAVRDLDNGLSFSQEEIEKKVASWL